MLSTFICIKAACAYIETQNKLKGEYKFKNKREQKLSKLKQKTGNHRTCAET